MASIAVLPILIGLAVDYAIQFQSRVAEERREDGAQAAVVRARPRSARPTIAIAALATATGFLVLLLSPVPMVQGFGLLLVVGIAVALACALTAGSAAIVLSDRDGGVLGASCAAPGEILRRRRRAAPRRRSAAAANAGRRIPRVTSGRRACSERGGAPGPRAGDRRRAGGARLGRGHPDGRPVRRHQARAVEHAGAARPPDARAGHRRLGRDRRHRPRARTSRRRRRSGG